MVYGNKVIVISAKSYKPVFGYFASLKPSFLALLKLLLDPN